MPLPEKPPALADGVITCSRQLGAFLSFGSYETTSVHGGFMRGTAGERTAYNGRRMELSSSTTAAFDE